METKQINIIPPSGMEIIREIKDGIETISFKLIEEKKITYKDVCNKLFVEASKKVYFITEDEISCCLTSYTAIKRSIGNESLTKEEQEATLCEGMLRNVARYLNPEGWKSVPTKVSKRWYFYIKDD